MRIACPFCGARELGEFTYLGDATPTRPAAGRRARTRVFDYVYLRDNSPASMQRALVSWRRLPRLAEGRPQHAARTRSSRSSRRAGAGAAKVASR